MEVPAAKQFPNDYLRCPRCFSKDIVMSLQAGLIDELMKRFGRLPRHCRSCGKRFYMRTSKLAQASETAP